jgi:PPP family 3-phenylpropionic acid transporter
MFTALWKRANIQHTSLLSIILLQLLSYSANALSKPYINLYLISVGVTASTIGILLSISALMEMTVPPILNRIADRFGWHRRLFVALLSAMALGHLLLISVNHIIVLAVATILVEYNFRPTVTLGLQLVITRMDQERRNAVGLIRSFSSLGFGLSSLLAGWLFTVGGYVLLFLSSAAAYLGSIGLTNSLPKTTTDQDDDKSNENKNVPRRRGFYVLALSMFFLMMGNRAGYAFWFVHFQENLGVSTSEISVIAALMALVEIPIFILLDRVLVHLDVRIAFIAGAIGMALIWELVGLLPSSVWIYPFMIFRGIVFAVFHLTTFLVIARVSFRANVATNQALIQGTIPSLATLLTGSIAGWLYDSMGATWLFTTAALVSLIGVAISVVGYRTLEAVQPEITASS